MVNEYGGERVRVKMANGEFKLGTIQDKMPGKHGFIGILFIDGTFEFVEEFDVNVIENELLELEVMSALCLNIQLKEVKGEPIRITKEAAHDMRKLAFNIIKITGWTAYHNVIIPELTSIIKGT